jgi:hypothetical protein
MDMVVLTVAKKNAVVTLPGGNAPVMVSVNAVHVYVLRILKVLCVI